MGRASGRVDERMQRGRRSERPTERVEVRGGDVVGDVTDEGDRGRSIRGTRYHSEVIMIIKVHSEVVQERASQQQSSIRATWALKEDCSRQSDAIRRNQQQSPFGHMGAEKGPSHSTSHGRQRA